MNTSSPFTNRFIERTIPKQSKLWVHILLFACTLLTTTIAGVVWQNDVDLSHLEKGLAYSLSLLFILTCHEFGHYFAARFHGVKSTLPYYIPLPPFSVASIGTMGAVIRMRGGFPSRKALFDIGIAGPIAGFIASMVVLLWGFSHLPGKEFILGIHPDYNFAIGSSPNIHPGQTLIVGHTLLYDLFAKVIPIPGVYVPPMTEMYHYPFLMAGWFGLFVTALNLLPIGQLDGGHVSYAMFGKIHAYIARLVMGLVVTSGILSFVPILLSGFGLETQLHRLLEIFPYWNEIFWGGWLFWALFIFVIIKLDHPPIEDIEPLSSGRMLLGWSALFMLIVSITPVPFLLF